MPDSTPATSLGRHVAARRSSSAAVAAAVDRGETASAGATSIAIDGHEAFAPQLSAVPGFECVVVGAWRRRRVGRREG
jgi:hypothetical protein